MEVGCPQTWGTETAHPKPKQPENPTARPTRNNYNNKGRIGVRSLEKQAT